MPSNPFSNEASAFVFKTARILKEKKASPSTAANIAAASGPQTFSDAAKGAQRESASPPPLKRKRKGGDSTKSSSNPSRKNSGTSSSPPADSGKRIKISANEITNAGDDFHNSGDPEPTLPPPPSPSLKDGGTAAPAPLNSDLGVPTPADAAGIGAENISEVSSDTLVPSNKGAPPKATSKRSVSDKSKVSFSFERDPEKPLTKDREKCKELFDLIGSASSRRTPLSPAERKDLSSSVALYHIRTGAMVHRLLLDSETKLSNAGKDSEMMSQRADALKEGLLKAQEELVKAKKASVEALERYRMATEEVGVLSEEVGRLKGELHGACLEKEELSLTIARLGEEREALQARLTEGADDVVGKFSRITAYVRDRELVDPIINSYVQVEAQARLLTMLQKRGVQIPKAVAKELGVEASELLREFASLPTPYLRPTDRCLVAPDRSPIGRSARTRSDDCIPEIAPGVVDQFGSNERIMSFRK